MVVLSRQYAEKYMLFLQFPAGRLHDWGISLVILLEFQEIKHQPFSMTQPLKKAPSPVPPPAKTSTSGEAAQRAFRTEYGGTGESAHAAPFPFSHAYAAGKQGGRMPRSSGVTPGTNGASQGRPNGVEMPPIRGKRSKRRPEVVARRRMHAACRFGAKGFPAFLRRAFLPNSLQKASPCLIRPFDFSASATTGRGAPAACCWLWKQCSPTAC